MTNQFMTYCKRCGRQILMTRSIEDGRWIPCDPLIHRYNPCGGPKMYVNAQGLVKYGKRDPNGEWGYQKHSMYCLLNRRNAG